MTQNTRRGAREFILPASTRPGNPPESRLLPDTTVELERLGLRPREVALDGGFEKGPTAKALERIAPDRVFIAGRQQPGSQRTQRRLAKYRTGAEGRISHLKRSYRLHRSRLKGKAGADAWSAWAILAYNLDTLAIRPDERLHIARSEQKTICPERPRPTTSAAVLVQPFIRGK